MKASVKFREDEKKPLFRAKVALNILGFPFRYGVEAGDATDLRFNLSTFFESGPLIKFSYRHNDSLTPFAVAVKTGIGRFGSPIGAPIAMAAEFNLLGTGSPSFFIHFRPQIGDFSIKRSMQSQIALPPQSSIFTPKFKAPADGANLEVDGSVDDAEPPGATGKRISFPVGKVIDSVFSGVELSAGTAVRLMNRAVLKLRWNLKFPAEFKPTCAGDNITNQTAGISGDKAPFLVLSKIGIEHVAADNSPHSSTGVAGTCLSMKRELDALRAQNESLRKGIAELRSEINAGKYSPVQIIGGKAPGDDGVTGKETDGNATSSAGT